MVRQLHLNPSILNYFFFKHQFADFIGNLILIFSLLNLSSADADMILPFIRRAEEEIWVKGYTDKIFKIFYRIKLILNIVIK